MLATKNRVGRLLLGLFAVLSLLTACSRTGPGSLLAGKKMLEAGKIESAIVELQAAVQLMPTNAAALNYLGVAYHRAGQWTNAIESYSRALRQDRDLIEVRFNLGCLYLEQNKLEEARTELLACTLKQGNDYEAWAKLGSVQLRLRDLTAAEKSFREALRGDARNVEALNGIGMVFAQRNRLRDAVDSFQAALKCQPGFAPALLNLATVLHQQNEVAGAMKCYREYLALQPRPADWEQVNAMVRSLEKPVANATRLATNNVVAPPTNQPAPKPVTMASPATRPQPVLMTKPELPVQPQPAAPPVERPASNPPPAEVVKLAPEPVINPKPDDSSVAAKPGARTSSASTESKGFFSKLNPFKRDAKNGSSPPASVAQTNAAAAVGRDEASGVETYSALPAGRFKAGDRKLAESALAQGQQLQRVKRSAEALQFYRRAVQLDESYFEAHYCLGLIAFELRSFKLAATAWENALALRPDSADARYNYALTLKADSRFPAAADELERLLSLHPDEARGHLTLGIIYADHLRDIPRARLHYNKVLQLDPRNPQAAAIRYWLVANPR